MQSVENTFWLKQMRLGQQQLDLGKDEIASQFYEKSFTEALWLLRYHLSKNCTQATVTQLVSMCKKSLQAYEQLNIFHENQSSVTPLAQLEVQYGNLENFKKRPIDEKPSCVFKALLETTATLWGARSAHKALTLDSAAQ